MTKFRSKYDLGDVEYKSRLESEERVYFGPYGSSDSTIPCSWEEAEELIKEHERKFRKIRRIRDINEVK